MIDIWDLTIPSLTGEAKRRAYCYYPDFLEEQPELRLPVLYMFDGHNLFDDNEATYGKSWGLNEYMTSTRTPLIIAAVECNHGPDNARLNEYSPFSGDMPGWGKVTGKGKATMEWMVRQFKPYIDANYPTLPDREHTFIGGSSMGGLMSLYAVTAYNRVFSRCAALSPSIFFAPEKTEKMLTGHRIGPNTVVYMDFGERELGRRGEGLPGDFGRYAAMLMDKGALVDCRIIPGGVHSEASWEKQIPFFMNTLFYDLS